MATTYLIIGLGNPGEEYEKTRHNIGRMAVESFADSIDIDEWKPDSAARSLVGQGTLGSAKIVCALPETFMNKSGLAAAYLAKAKKTKAENVIVVQDDMDLPAGTIRLSFDRGSGGHRGIESIIKALKTREFVRVRVGVSPTTPSGKLRKPVGDRAKRGSNPAERGEDKVVRFLLTKMRDADMAIYKKVFKKTNEALASVVEEGRERAMNLFN